MYYITGRENGDWPVSQFITTIDDGTRKTLATWEIVVIFFIDFSLILFFLNNKNLPEYVGSLSSGQQNCAYSDAVALSYRRTSPGHHHQIEMI
jgi:hypothetical protein